MVHKNISDYRQRFGNLKHLKTESFLHHWQATLTEKSDFSLLTLVTVKRLDPSNKKSLAAERLYVLYLSSHSKKSVRSRFNRYTFSV